MNSPAPVLPPEIYAYICEQVDPAQLGPVCRVSRLLRDQAQRILYRTVDLRGRKIKSVRSWCLAVTRHSHLAERVHSLSLQPPSDLDPADAERISIALRKCTNLKSLTVLRVRIPYTSGSLHTWMLEDCPFRLTAFTNSYFNPGRLEKVWDTQREIRVLSFPETFPPSAFTMNPGTPLPNLIALEVPCHGPLGAMRHLANINRPLQRIQMQVVQSLPDLSQFSRTLTTLTLGRSAWYTGNPSIEDIFLSVARMLPELLHLGISEPKAAMYHAEDVPINALGRFSRIETLVLELSSIVRFARHTSNPSIFFHLDSPDNLHEFGLTIMQACPTLRQTALAITTPAAEKFTCILARTLGSDTIHAEAGTSFNFDAVSKFWTG
ncbi:hypothetical protein C8J57DRAFT_1278767 [Mycena rebaudengoi]|nr:hypothetical protein C8J57DRAFT_1278767 [Mycena rebaudengoi]